MFPLDYIADVVNLMSEDPKLIIRAVTLELVQPTSHHTSHIRLIEVDIRNGTQDDNKFLQHLQH